MFNVAFRHFIWSFQVNYNFSPAPLSASGRGPLQAYHLVPTHYGTSVHNKVPAALPFQGSA